MARPPIIISNGGVLDKLTGKPLMDAIRELNNSGRATASWIDCDYNNIPMIIWHLKEEDEDALNDLLKVMYPHKNATLGDEIKK